MSSGAGHEAFQQALKLLLKLPSQIVLLLLLLERGVRAWDEPAGIYPAQHQLWGMALQSQSACILQLASLHTSVYCFTHLLRSCQSLHTCILSAF